MKALVFWGTFAVVVVSGMALVFWWAVTKCKAEVEHEDDGGAWPDHK